MQLLELLIVEIIRFLAKIGNVLFPGSYRIGLIDPNGAENRLPQRINLLLRRQMRKYLGCPSLRRNGNDRPGKIVGHLQLAILAHRFGIGFLMIG
ncbi:hypothetical protein D3C77_526860 [compost metagenome]